MEILRTSKYLNFFQKYQYILPDETPSSPCVIRLNDVRNVFFRDRSFESGNDYHSVHYDYNMYEDDNSSQFDGGMKAAIIETEADYDGLMMIIRF